METMNMSVGLHQGTAEAHPYDGVTGVDDSLIEQVWRELGGQLPRKRVGCVVTEVALGFQNAPVKAFLQILIHRLALERLRQELDEMDSTENRLLDEQQ